MPDLKSAAGALKPDTEITDRLKVELQAYLAAQATRVLTGAGRKLGESTTRLNDIAEGNTVVDRHGPVSFGTKLEAGKPLDEHRHVGKYPVHTYAGHQGQQGSDSEDLVLEELQRQHRLAGSCLGPDEGQPETKANHEQADNRRPLRLRGGGWSSCASQSCSCSCGWSWSSWLCSWPW